jgi:hypothetical protein
MRARNSPANEIAARKPTFHADKNKACKRLVKIDIVSALFHSKRVLTINQYSTAAIASPASGKAVLLPIPAIEFPSTPDDFPHVADNP